MLKQVADCCVDDGLVLPAEFCKNESSDTDETGKVDAAVSGPEAHTVVVEGHGQGT